MILMLCLIPMLGMSQTKNVLNSSRYFCKNDKIDEFEKALANHAQKYHSGDWKWRVWSIQSGPDAGGYMITEGPSDWATIDGRNDINPAHMADWNKNVAPLTTNPGSSSYMNFEADLSSVQLTDYADKIIITHMTAKPGKIMATRDLITKLNKVWTSSNESIAVYSLVASGEPGYAMVSRLKGGLKELAPGFRKPMMERYNDTYGAGAWDNYSKDYADAVQNRWSELLIYMPKLSSK